MSQTCFSPPQRTQMAAKAIPDELVAALEEALANNPAVLAGTFDWNSLIADVAKILSDAPKVVPDLLALFAAFNPFNFAAVAAAVGRIIADSPAVVTDVIALVQLIWPPATAPTP